MSAKGIRISVFMTQYLYADNGIYIRWHEDEEHVLYVEVTRQPTWELVYQVITFINQLIFATPHPVFTVYHFSNYAGILPKGNILTHLSKLVHLDPPNEKLVIFVSETSLLRSFLQMASDIYGLRDILAKYRFCKSLSEAFALIDHYRKAHA